MLAIAGEVGLEQFGFSLQKKLNSVFQNAGDDFTRVSQAAAWLYYAERPPFNIPSFNHWHFYSQPINPNNLSIETHIDVDNLKDNFDSIRKSVRGGKVSRTWPFAFLMKLYLTGMCDIYSPLHVSELFNEQFPNGDRNGRDFYVKYNGNFISLYDLWETGCGYFDSQVDFTSEDDWKKIDKLTNELSLAFTSEDWPSTLSVTQVIEGNYNYTRDTVYNGLVNGSEVSKEYITTCQNYAQDIVILAGKRIATDLANLNIIEIAKQIPYANAIRSSEVAAWSILFIFTPFAALLIWKKHFSTK
ncbi:hypothetical protein TVAG_150370 [Trichomonas vaginalis G3]|uniref:Uncharacterized protein n=2 Tax=Trichomonas vaginalis (strain ATCC PRA-98 / G3) TaxID=412133 RepID=A2DRT9_TRIV3|nr:hypothetical protein TVAG_150370 [Trichomonas vaginalis G3]|eukprot:XP_001329109.1 hypothetical protein [Trichomonas vaginalis G3]